MAIAFPVSDIIERVRVRADLPAFTSDTNVTTAMILSMVQESARDLSGLMAESDWYFTTTINLTTTPGIAVVSLPPNFSELHALTWDREPDRSLLLERANIDEMRAYPDLAWDACNPKFRLSGSAIEFFPTPKEAHEVMLRYSTGAFITSAADTFFGHVGWDTWIVLNCVCIVKQRHEKDYSAFAMERDMKLREIKRRRRGNGVALPRDVRGPAPDALGRWGRMK